MSAICPPVVKVVPMSTTERPVTQTAEQAVKAASDQPPHVPAVRAQGEESTIAPMMISAIKPNAREKRLFI